MKLDKLEESEMEMLLNEIPHATSPHLQYHHHQHDRLPSHDMDGLHHHAHDVTGEDWMMEELLDRLEAIYIKKDSIDPSFFQTNPCGIASRIPMGPSRSSVLPNPQHSVFYPESLGTIDGIGFSPSISFQSQLNWFDLDQYPNALNSPTQSLSSVRNLQNLDAFNSDDSFIMQKKGLHAGKDDSFNILKERKRWNLDDRKNSRGGVPNGNLYSLIYDNLIGNKGISCYLAKDQHGCRFLQRKFDEGKHHVDLIFDGIIDHTVELMEDPFGNYLMQKLFDFCSEEQRTGILLMLTKDPAKLIRISLNIHGTRSVQKLIETLKTTQQIALVMLALRPGFLDLIKDPNGNHVVQHCLACLKTEDNKFIFDAAAKHCVDIATHRHGCCVLQRCITYSTGEHRANLVAKISANGLLLAQDAYGNYVVQNILGLKSPSVNASLASQFKGNFVHLSMQKFSSNVVEKCFKEFGEDDKARIVFELLSVSQFERLLQDPYANYVIQSALANTKGALHVTLVDAIRPHAKVLRTSPYCKRILLRTLSKKCCAF